MSDELSDPTAKSAVSTLLNKPTEAKEDDEELFDKLMVAIGNYGFFQRRFNIIFNFILVAFMTMPFLNLVQALSVPNHHCHIPGQEESNFTKDEWLLRHIPLEIDPKTGHEALSACKMYNGSERNTSEIIDCQYGWDYDDQWFSSTAASDHDWVCDKKLYVTNSFVASRVGEIIGMFILGQFGDRLGRRPVFFISLSLLVVGRIMTVWTSHSYALFLTMIFIGSSASISIYQTPLVIGMETAAENKRSQIAFMQCVAWVLGSCTLPLVYWAFGKWRWVLVVTSLPSVSAFKLFRMLPESPRWLASQGHIRKSQKVLQYIADLNGTKLPENTTDTLQKIGAKKEKTYGLLSLFMHKRLAITSATIVICWVVCGLSYYSLKLNISNMAGNPFLNFFWQSLVELPGYLIARSLSERFGRRWTHTGSYVIAIVLSAAVIANHGGPAWLTTAFVACVKFSITVAFYMVGLQAMEVYPTCLRQTGLALGAVVTNIFGILGPYVVYLGTSIDGRLPYAILLCTAILGCGCSAMLPETLNKKLPETMEDAQNFGKGQKFWSFNITKSAKASSASHKKT